MRSVMRVIAAAAAVNLVQRTSWCRIVQAVAIDSSQKQPDFVVIAAPCGCPNYSLNIAIEERACQDTPYNVV